MNIYMYTHIYKLQQRRKVWKGYAESTGGGKGTHGLILAFLTEHIRTSINLFFHPSFCLNFFPSLSCLIHLFYFFLKHRGMGLIKASLCTCIFKNDTTSYGTIALWLRRNPTSAKVEK